MQVGAQQTPEQRANEVSLLHAVYITHAHTIECPAEEVDIHLQLDLNVRYLPAATSSDKLVLLHAAYESHGREAGTP